MKRIVAGILAHVDAGKTTLSEALLYRSGKLRKLGRVDHGDAFLDTDAMEKRRGITIFAHQAQAEFDDLHLTLLDTPGHVDFAAETERTLHVLDYAILVISGTDGVQGHTETLWRLLQQHQVPTFIFVNKMDAPGADISRILDQLKKRLSDACTLFTAPDLPDDSWENIAMQDETAMNEFLENGKVANNTIRSMIAAQQLFPCYFGSALKLDGVEDLIHGLQTYTQEPVWPEKFGARVYKISHDSHHDRLTWLRVTGAGLKAKSLLTHQSGEDSVDTSSAVVAKTDSQQQEKIDQIRVYNGAKFTTVDEVPAGSICAVSGPDHTFPGEGFGIETSCGSPSLQPVLTYTLLPGDNDIHRCMAALRELEDEDPLLHVQWQERLQEIHLQLMGAIQLEIIQQMMADRFGLHVDFGPGGILYKETIAEPVEGVGHFEPLRHYAEVHLLLEPGERGSGMQFATDCSLDVLDRNWQRLILTHLQEKEHLGVLTGSPLTDMRITLLTGRAHLKHTEGGDFRQATYRAIRQGLMTLKQRNACQLLEPWYRFRLEVPQNMLGRAISDVQRMSGETEPPRISNDFALLEGTAPVADMRDYAMDVNAYTHGLGRFSCVFDGYRECHNAETVIDDMAYDPMDDLENTPDSVFCAHGAGYNVAWEAVPSHMHLDYVWQR